jgi:hypothetical protein
MAGVLQHLRSSTLNKRPNPASMVDGQLAINYASGSPGAYFKDSNGNLVKVGPVHVGSGAPNASPASGGTAGNSLGEQWLDTSGGTYVFKVWDGSAWRSESGTFVDVAGDTMTGDLTAPAFIPNGSTVPTNGVYLPAANTVAISTNSSERIRIGANGEIGIGGANYGTSGQVLTSAGSGAAPTWQTPAAGNADKIEEGNSSAEVIDTGSDGRFVVTTEGTERARVDSSGRLLVGTSTSRGGWFNTSGQDSLIQTETTTQNVFSGVQNSNSALGPWILLGKSRGTTAGAVTAVQNDDPLGGITFQGADGTEMVDGCRIQAYVDGTPGANDLPTRLVFATTADGASSPTERLRITSDGDTFIGKTGFSSSTAGIELQKAGAVYATRDGSVCGLWNRLTSDGDIIIIQQASVTEGSISVSGTTVSYNGAHLSRWSQLPSGAERTEILRGSVLSNVDEMCEWGDEENEQLNRMKVSDVEGDKNVSGVFQAWDDDDDTYTNDFYCAMTGDFIIRIGAGVTIEQGDLLMSAGDGTAKPQDDDLIRSCTVAKVTSTTVSCTYDDGSYCVPCVLMAC